MKITINPVLDMETLEFLPRPSYEYSGPLILFGGASAEAKANEQAQTEFLQQMHNEQSQQFGNQSQVLQQLRDTWEPILKAGPNQTGFSADENAALRTQITDTGAQAVANAKDAAALRQKQESGGTPVLPTGAQEQINAGIDVLGGQKTASALNQETAANYATGRQNFENATTAEGNVAGLQNPVGYAGATNSAAGQALSAINYYDSTNTSMLDSILGGVVNAAGTAAGAFLGA